MRKLINLAVISTPFEPTYGREMLKAILSLTMSLLAQLPLPIVEVDATECTDGGGCSSSYCCDSSWNNCTNVGRSGICPAGTLQGWCNNCYTGSSSCGPDGKRCCD